MESPGSTPFLDAHAVLGRWTVKSLPVTTQLLRHAVERAAARSGHGLVAQLVRALC